jgi:hypothetical protein
MERQGVPASLDVSSHAEARRLVEIICELNRQRDFRSQLTGIERAVGGANARCEISFLDGVHRNSAEQLQLCGG